LEAARSASAVWSEAARLALAYWSAEARSASAEKWGSVLAPLDPQPDVHRAVRSAA
jgi:hypothetical protein